MFFAGQTSWRDKEPGSFACALDETPWGFDFWLARQSGAEADVAAPVADRIVQVQSEGSPGRAPIVPVPATKSDQRIATRPPQKAQRMDFIHPPSILPISLSIAAQFSYFLNGRKPSCMANLISERR